MLNSKILDGKVMDFGWKGHMLGIFDLNKN